MRSMQFGGKPIELAPSRIYNCAYAPIDSVLLSSLKLCFFYSVVLELVFPSRNITSKNLGKIHKPDPNDRQRFLIGDSIEGWADAVRALIRSYYDGGPNYVFDFGDIRPKGALLITSGGKAPGPDPLRVCLVNVETILNLKQDGEKLTPLECHDIVCHIADAVLAGGIRRAALISLFSVDDEDMVSCKSGSWWETNPQRGRANNSAVLLRHKLTETAFFNLWERIEASGSGEPGFYLSNDKDWGTNPCCEIALRPYQFCNLCEVNVSDVTSQEDYEARVRAAAFIGTLQAGYTDFHYLRDIWKKTTEKDALIGVSMTGIGSASVLGLDMTSAARIVKKENARVAKLRRHSTGGTVYNCKTCGYNEFNPWDELGNTRLA